MDWSIKELAIKTAGGDAPVTSLSGGNQQKCILARWLLVEPRLLLLDEPTRGIDVGAKAEIYQLIRRLAAQGRAIIMTSSELPELLAVADRIIVLCEGRITAEIPRAEATEEAIMHAATRFLDRRQSRPEMDLIGIRVIRVDNLHSEQHNPSCSMATSECHRTDD